jgi:3'-phosphoadenosine 5'-phosphosulfate (PAPS) 3'-phosphatase
LPTLDASACAVLLDELTAIAARAAEAILALARRLDVRTKADGSSVTAADEAAEAIICVGLRRISPTLPIISEEQAAQKNPVKFCWIADGRVDLYPRLATTHDWDIAAGNLAGGRRQRHLPGWQCDGYGTKELLIPAFVGHCGIKD